MGEENKDQLPKQSSEFPIQEYKLVPINGYEGFEEEDDEINLIN